jgi:hypothetical protein
MRLRVLILVIAVALVFAIPYTVYALDYKGNYIVTASMTVSVDALGTFSSTTPAISSEPMGVWDFWDVFKGHGTDRPDVGYQVYLEITQSGDLVGTGITAIRIYAGESLDMTITADNVSPGQAEVRVYFVDIFTDAIVYDKTIQETIP